MTQNSRFKMTTDGTPVVTGDLIIQCYNAGEVFVQVMDKDGKPHGLRIDINPFNGNLRARPWPDGRAISISDGCVIA